MGLNGFDCKNITGINMTEKEIKKINSLDKMVLNNNDLKHLNQLKKGQKYELDQVKNVIKYVKDKVDAYCIESKLGYIMNEHLDKMVLN